MVEVMMMITKSNIVVTILSLVFHVIGKQMFLAKTPSRKDLIKRDIAKYRYFSKYLIIG